MHGICFGTNAEAKHTHTPFSRHFCQIQKQNQKTMKTHTKLGTLIKDAFGTKKAPLIKDCSLNWGAPKLKRPLIKAFKAHWVDIQIWSGSYEV